MKSATILMTIPKKRNDATTHTAVWAEGIYKLAKSLGYNVIAIRGKDTTYDNVTKAIEKYRPRVFIHVGHGCRSHINGQDQCIVTRKYSIDELSNMPFEKLDWLMNPVKLSGCGKDVCSLNNDVCMPLCFNETNVHLLKDTLVMTIACHSSSQLGRCAVAYGATAYMGYSDLLLFPVDGMRSQDEFGNFHVELMRNILLGDSVGDAYNKMMKMEDLYIRANKGVKWLALPSLWNHKCRELLGDANATIY